MTPTERSAEAERIAIECCKWHQDNHMFDNPNREKCCQQCACIKEALLTFSASQARPLVEALKGARLTVLMFKDMLEKEGWTFNEEKELRPIEQALTTYKESLK